MSVIDSRRPASTSAARGLRAGAVLAAAVAATGGVCWLTTALLGAWGIGG